MTYKVLTVDDSRTIRMIVKKAFQAFNCELFEAENGMEGLALAAKIIPDLIVLDITMPVMTGIEMLSKLKENIDLKAIPVIMLTAESGKDNVMNIVKMGVRDYIVKPFKGDQLIERARHILDLKRGAQPKQVSEGPRALDCFGVDGDFLILSLPAKITRTLGAQIESAAKEKIDQMNPSWAHKLVVDLCSVADINMNVIQMMISICSYCSRTKIPFRMVAATAQADALKGFQETRTIETVLTVEQAKTALSA
jgi:DNA-binding response OmpR family regulator